MSMAAFQPASTGPVRHRHAKAVASVARHCAISVAILLAVGAAGLRALAVLAPPAEAGVWACGESLKVAPDMPPPARNSVWDGKDGRIRLFGARQEYVGFQVVVRAGAEPLKSVELRVSPLRSTAGAEIAASNIDLFRQHYLRVTVPSQYDTDVPVPDARAGEQPVQMVPLREGRPGAAFDVGAGRNQPLWVDVYIPEDQAPGDYQGEAVVAVAGKPLQRLPIQLTVWGFTLPRETHLKNVVPTGVEQLRWGFKLDADNEPALRKIEDQVFQLAHQHRLNFQPSQEDDLVAEWGGPYRKYLTGAAYKERAGKGVGPNLLMTGVGGESQEEITRSIKQVVSWWKAQPESVRKATTLACYVYDEPQDDEDFAAVEARGKWLRAAIGKELPLFLTTTKPQRVPAGLIDAWGELPAAEVPRHQARGERVWATNQGYAAGPYVDTAGYAGRTQGWMAWKMGLDAWHFWDGCYWVDRQNIYGSNGKRLTYREVNASPQRFLTDTWTNPLTFDQKRNPRQKDWIRLNGDGVLFYPGTPAGLQEPLASFTLKSLRRGLQDYEYLWLLRKQGKSADDLVDRLVPRPNEWARDPEAWDNARIELGKRLDDLAASPR
ncbi:MAG: hypothetical protein ACO1SX_09605 [Actinomycetota bacterium]